MALNGTVLRCCSPRLLTGSELLLTTKKVNCSRRRDSRGYCISTTRTRRRSPSLRGSSVATTCRSACCPCTCILHLLLGEIDQSPDRNWGGKLSRCAFGFAPSSYCYDILDYGSFLLPDLLEPERLFGFGARCVERPAFRAGPRRLLSPSALTCR